MRLVFEQTFRDILEVNRTAREQRLKGWVVLLSGIGLLTFGIALLFAGDERSISLFLFGAAFSFLGMLAPYLAAIGAWYLKVQSTPYELEIDSSGITFFDRDPPEPVAWNNFSRWYQAQDLLVLVGGGDALAIPKRCCTDHEWQALLDIVRTNMK